MWIEILTPTKEKKKPWYKRVKKPYRKLKQKFGYII